MSYKREDTGEGGPIILRGRGMPKYRGGTYSYPHTPVNKKIVYILFGGLNYNLYLCIISNNGWGSRFDKHHWGSQRVDSNLLIYFISIKKFPTNYRGIRN
jgi:hypothetical protein